jgi:Phage-related minor tail protein
MRSFLSSLRVVITGSDQTGPMFDSVTKSSAKFEQRAKKVGGAFQKMGAGLIGTAGAIGVSLGLQDVPGQVLRVEHGLQSVANIGKLSDSTLKGLQQNIDRISKSTNQYQETLLEGLNTLVAKGLSPEDAIKILEPIGVAATGAQADINELAVSGYVSLSTLEVPINQITKSLDIMAMAGQQGSFELKDMAKHLPSLAAGVASLGVKGQPAIASIVSALQISQLGAGDSDEAATNFQNFLNKMTSQETLQRFNKAGIDLKRVIKDSLKFDKNGKQGDPFAAMMDTIEKYTKGDRFKLGELFNDMQAVKFINAMSLYRKEYQAIKETSLGAQGTNQENFEGMMRTNIEQMKRSRILAQSALGEPIRNIFTKLNAKLIEFNSNGKNTEKLLYTLGGAVITGGTLIALGTLLKSITDIVGAIKLVSVALPGLMRVLAANPTLLALAGIALVGMQAYRFAKQAGEESGQEGLKRDSEARQRLRGQTEEASWDLKSKVDSLHKKNANAFDNLVLPSQVKARLDTNSKMNTDKGELTIKIEGAPAGTKATVTQQMGTIQLNPKMGITAPR